MEREHHGFFDVPQRRSCGGDVMVARRKGQLGRRIALGIEVIDQNELHADDSLRRELRAQIGGRWRLGLALALAIARPAQLVALELHQHLDVAVVGGDVDSGDEAQRHAAERGRRAEGESLHRFVEICDELNGIAVQ
jgi:hypothetical protein